MGNIDKSLFLSPEMLRLVRAERCQRRFWCFVQQFWHTVVPEEPVWNWHMEYIADEMQVVAERIFQGVPKEYDLIINVPPGSSKSTIITIMFTPWCWTRMPSFRSICASYSFPLSIDLAARSRDIVLSTQYRLYWPGISLREDTRGKAHFKNTAGGSRYATSVGGTVTGMHGHCHLVDDPLNPKEAVSVADLATANNWMERTLPTRSIDKAITPTVLIMQRLGEDDPTGHMLEKAKVEKGLKLKHICLPATLSDRVSPTALRERYSADGLLDPVRMNREVLAEQKSKLGSFTYAAQYDEHPVPLEGGLFKLDKCPRMRDREPVNWRHVLCACRYWDKGATEGGGAYTVGVLLLKMDTKASAWPTWVVADVVRGQWSALIRDKTILDTATKDGVKVAVVVEQEPGGGGKSDAQATVRSLAGFAVSKDKVQTAKELRAIPFASQVEAGNVGIIPGYDWYAEYVHELSLYPASKYFDQVDASSGAFNTLVSTGALVW